MLSVDVGEWQFSVSSDLLRFMGMGSMLTELGLTIPYNILHEIGTSSSLNGGS